MRGRSLLIGYTAQMNPQLKSVAGQRVRFALVLFTPSSAQKAAENPVRMHAHVFFALFSSMLTCLPYGLQSRNDTPRSYPTSHYPTIPLSHYYPTIPSHIPQANKVEMFQSQLQGLSNAVNMFILGNHGGLEDALEKLQKTKLALANAPQTVRGVAVPSQDAAPY